jgi:hypothetical protein
MSVKIYIKETDSLGRTTHRDCVITSKTLDEALSKTEQDSVVEVVGAKLLNKRVSEKKIKEDTLKAVKEVMLQTAHEQPTNV